MYLLGVELGPKVLEDKVEYKRNEVEPHGFHVRPLRMPVGGFDLLQH